MNNRDSIATLIEFAKIMSAIIGFVALALACVTIAIVVAPR